MDYRGTDGNDLIDQARLGLAPGSNIFGGKGNDTISFGHASVYGEAGDDTLNGSGALSTAVYLGSPGAIEANLSTGVVKDGYGGTDKLSNVRILQATVFDDKLTGSGADEVFWGLSGNNSIDGAGGADTAVFWDITAAECTIAYDAALDTFTVRRNKATSLGTDVLKGVERLVFRTPTGQETIYTKEDFTPGYLKHFSDTLVPRVGANSGLQQLAAGDFNGDGKRDVMLLSVDNATRGASATPLQVLLGDGRGGFTNGTAALFGASVPTMNYVPRVVVADFNKDGADDIFAADFGIDAPPFPGGQNRLFLSQGGKLVDATSTLPQRLSQGHGMSVGDVDKDGDIDLLVNSLNDSTHADDLFLNDGSGKFALANERLPSTLNPGRFVAGHSASLIADFTGDGHADIVLGAFDAGTPRSSIMVNNGSGAYSNTARFELPASGVKGQVALDMRAIDLNHDTLPDMVVSYTNGGPPNEFYATPYLQFLLNEGNGKFRDVTDVSLPQARAGEGGWYKFVDVVDLNGDGAQDIVATLSWTQGARHPGSAILLNDGAGRFHVAREFDSGTTLAAVDVDGNGVAEILLGRETGLRVYANDLPRVDPGRWTGGTAQADTITAAAMQGNTLLNGGGGIDTLQLQGSRADVDVAVQHDAVFVRTRADGSTDTLVGVERLQFGDGNLAFDIDGAAGQVFRVYQAAFNRAPDAGGLGFWIYNMDHGMSLRQVAEGFTATPEYAAAYAGASGHRDLVGRFYQNVLHRDGEPGGMDFWTGLLDSRTLSVAEVLVAFAEGPENQAALVGVTANGIAYTPFG